MPPCGPGKAVARRRAIPRPKPPHGPGGEMAGGRRVSPGSAVRLVVITQVSGPATRRRVWDPSQAGRHHVTLEGGPSSESGSGC